MGSQKDIKQEKDEGSGEVFNKVERIYGGRRYLEEERKFKKCKRINRRIRMRGGSS